MLVNLGICLAGSYASLKEDGALILPLNEDLFQSLYHDILN